MKQGHSHYIHIVKGVKRKMKKFKEFTEEIANVSGSGAIAGTGVTPPDKPANWGEPGVSPQNQKKHKLRILRRKSPI